MKKIMVLAVFVFSIMLMSCFDFNFGSSLEGNWVITGYVDHIFTEDTSYTWQYLYNPDVDQCFNATVVKIDDNKMFAYDNNGGINYSVDTMYTVSYSADTLYLSYDESEDTLTIPYYFTDRNHLIWVIDADEYYTYEMHLEKYTGQIPPDSWVMEISDDEYEPDNDIDHATLLRMNDVQSHTLTENDTDYYHIQAGAGKSYLIRGLSYFEIQLYLYDPDGDSVAYDNNNDLKILNLGDETETALLWTCEAAGDYYPMIVSGRLFPWNSLQSSQKGYYQMIATEVDTNDIEYGSVDLPVIGYRTSKDLDIFNNMFSR